MRISITHRKEFGPMTKRIVLMALALSLTAVPVFAQAPKAEVGVFLGWVFADGVSGDNFKAGDGNVYNRVDPKDSFGWGLDVGVFVTPNAEVGFIFANQPTKLTVGGTATKDVGDMTINTYHGYAAYNWGDRDNPVRPYFLFGLGATSYSDVTYTAATGAARTVTG